MLLAANVGNEGALRQAARTGDGRLFVELRHRILVAEASNRSLVSALAQLGDDLQLVELQQIAASAALGATAGAPVGRSLAAKCATLRSALASEQETEARLRTGKITVPLVGMSVLIMAAVDLSRPQRLSGVAVTTPSPTHQRTGGGEHETTTLPVDPAVHRDHRRDQLDAALRPAGAAGDERDRGAVSLEQVLWFVAAGVAVAVIAGIVWAKIRDQANTDPAVPGAP